MAGMVPGGSSLLVIFAVLVLTVLAVMGISAVTAETRLVQQTGQAIEDYYEADCQAEMVLAALRQGDVPGNVEERDGVYWYTCKISQYRNLEAAVSVTDDGFMIRRWQTVAADTWEPDERMQVWDGEVILEEKEGEGEGIWPF